MHVLVGSLLQVPIYIVTMTNLHTQHDLMQAKSMAAESDVRSAAAIFVILY